LSWGSLLSSRTDYISLEGESGELASVPPRPLASISADADRECRAALAKYRQFQQYRTPRPVAAASVMLNSNFMLQSISAEIIYCRERARQAREKADTASAADAKRDHLAAEARWLSLAHSHELQQQLSTMLGGHRHVAPTEGKRTHAFEPEVIGTICDAFRRVLAELGLFDRDDVIALKAARLIIGLAARGERDPERLKAAALTWMK
jgi:hypothetical protein